jgi:hypothetical protein
MAQIKSDSDLEAIQQQKLIPKLDFTSSYYYYKNHNYEINLYASFSALLNLSYSKSPAFI